MEYWSSYWLAVGEGGERDVEVHFKFDRCPAVAVASNRVDWHDVSQGTCLLVREAGAPVQMYPSVRYCFLDSTGVGPPVKEAKYEYYCTLSNYYITVLSHCIAILYCTVLMYCIVAVALYCIIVLRSVMALSCIAVLYCIVVLDCIKIPYCTVAAYCIIVLYCITRVSLTSPHHTDMRREVMKENIVCWP